MARATIPFGEWLPDLSGPHGGLEVADNVFPAANGYAPVPDFVAESGLPGLTGRVLGAMAVRGADRRTTLLAGTQTGLFKRTPGAWVSVGSGFSAGITSPWEFVQFGNRLIASNGIDLPVYYDLALGGNAVVLPNAPRFKLSTVVLDFIVTAVVEGDVMRVQWSGINNSEEWRFGYGQSDLNIASSGGAITGLVGGEYGLVFQEERISRMRYVGGDVIFQFDPISKEIGCRHHRSVCSLGRMAFFLSEKGFYRTDGSDVYPIGDERVDRTFIAASKRFRLDRMSATIDPVRKLALWTLPDDEPGVIYAYSWTLNRWSRILQPARLLFSTRERAVTIGEDAPPLPDDLLLGDGLPFGDPAFKGGALSLGIFNDANILGSFSGGNKAATLATAETSLVSGRSARIQSVRPVGDVSSGVSVRLRGKLRHGDPFTDTLHSGLRPSGDIPARRSLRHVQMQLEIAAGVDWSFLQGLEVEYEAGPGR